ERNSNVFKVSVNVEKQNKVLFHVTYEELLSRKLGLYKHIINLDPGQIVQDFKVVVNIEESTDITELKVAALKQNDVQHEIGNSLAKIERPNPHTAVVRFAPTPEQQKSFSSSGISGQFTVQYDVDRSSLHSQILVNDGYFTHYFAPEKLKPLPKHVVFVLDISTSMAGRKINQLKEAMETILGDLHSEDYFTLVKFSSEVQIWRLVNDGQWDNATLQESDCSSLVVPATKENILRGKLAINKLKEQGCTNIHQAMLIATHITQLGKKLKCSPTPEPIIIFLTDGQPTAGICQKDEIIREVTRVNQMGKATIFALGLGDDVDFEFLKKLALCNSGFSRKIYEASDTALQLTEFYKEVSSPLLSNITFIYQPEQVESISITRHNFVTFYHGSELIVSGRIDPSLSEMEFRFGVTGNSSEGLRNFVPEETRVVFLKKAGFMERLWAYLTIQQLLDEEKKLEGEMSRNKRNEAMQLALKYSFVTPVTSLVVVRPDDQLYRATLDSERETEPEFDCDQSLMHDKRLSVASCEIAACSFESQSTLNQISNFFSHVKKKKKKVPPNHGLFGSSNQGSQALPVFGSAVPPNQGNHGLFGSSNQGSQALPVFGSAVTPNQGNHGLFGSSNQGSQALPVFGSAVTPNQGNHGLFGSSNQGSQALPVFGSVVPPNQGNHGLFGSSNQGSQALPVFGSTVPPNQGNHGLFGSSNQGSQALPVFGSTVPPNQGNHGLFGSSNQGSQALPVFGSVVPPNQGNHGLFGSSNQGSQALPAFRSAVPPRLSTGTAFSLNEGSQKSTFGKYAMRRSWTPVVPTSDVAMNSIVLLLATFMVSRLTGPHRNVQHLKIHVPDHTHSLVVLPLKTLEYHVRTTIRYQYAQTVVTTKVHNPTRSSQEVVFSTLLPDSAFVSAFLMDIDGLVYDGFIKEKSFAKKKYRKGLPKENYIKHNLSMGLYNHVVYLDPGQLVDDFVASVDIKESVNIVSFLSTPVMVNYDNDMNLMAANNIYEAIKLALDISYESKKQLQDISSNHILNLPNIQSIVVLFTDGIPTTGELNLGKILLNSNRWNRKCKAAIFTIAVGENINNGFMKKLSEANSGFMVRIYESSDTKLQLTDFYPRVSSPLLSNITFMYDPTQVNTSSLTNTRFETFFYGSELMVSGQLSNDITLKDLHYKVTGRSPNGIKIYYPETKAMVVPDHGIGKKPGILERIWAYLKIRFMLKGGRCKCTNKQKALQLTLKYSFLTPITSMIMVRTDGRP
ncbi:hypothetical protein L9F63_010526, partial [Diploptera punctata]